MAEECIFMNPRILPCVRPEPKLEITRNNITFGALIGRFYGALKLRKCKSKRKKEQIVRRSKGIQMFSGANESVIKGLVSNGVGGPSENTRAWPK